MATLEYLSWSAFLITSDDGLRVLIDPWVSGTPDGRVPRALRSPAEFADCDIILVTHAAKDHLGQTWEIMRAGHARVAGSHDVRILAEEQGFPPDRSVMMMPNSPYHERDVTVIPVEAKHVSVSQLGNGQWLFGMPLSYFVRFDSGRCIFHGGDTAISLDLRLWAELYRPTTAILGIGGLPHPGRQPVVEMSPVEAALAAHMMNVKVAIPCHYPPESDAPDEFAAALRTTAPGVRFMAAAPGVVEEVD